MACLEHECNRCLTLWFSNRQDEPCPECGGFDFHTTFDETPDHDDYDDGDEPWDGEDV